MIKYKFPISVLKKRVAPVFLKSKLQLISPTFTNIAQIKSKSILGSNYFSYSPSRIGRINRNVRSNDGFSAWL